MVQVVRSLPAIQETQVQSLGWADSPGEGNGYPLQFCLENSMDRGAWQATVHRVAENQTRLRFHRMVELNILNCIHCPQFRLGDQDRLVNCSLYYWFYVVLVYESDFFQKKNVDSIHSKLSQLASERTLRIFQVQTAHSQSDLMNIHKITTFSSKRRSLFGVEEKSSKCDMPKWCLSGVSI